MAATTLAALWYFPCKGEIYHLQNHSSDFIVITPHNTSKGES